MITRHECYKQLFKLKEQGDENAVKYIDLLAKSDSVPKEIIKYLTEEDIPQFKFFKYLYDRQRTLLKNIMDYDKLDLFDQVKICSSIITRAMIAIQYKEIDGELLDQLSLDKLSEALYYTFNSHDFTTIEPILKEYRDSVKLFYERRNYKK